MKVSVKLHTYLVTDKGSPSLIPCDHMMSADELKAERKNHDSVFYAGQREYMATVDADADPAPESKANDKKKEG